MFINAQIIHKLKHFFHLIDFERINVYSSSIAFYTFLSAFPAISAIVSVYLIFMTQLPDFSRLMTEQFVPIEVQNIIFKQIEQIMKNRALSLVGVSLSLFIGLWMANMAMKSLMRGLSYCFGVEKRRGVVSFYFYSFVLTILFIILAVISLLILSMPHILNIISFEHPIYNLLLSLLNIFITTFLLIFSLGLVYKYIPPHKTKIKLSFYFPGAAFAAFLSITASLIFSFYIANFANINKIYGAFSSVIIFMLWLQFMASSILLGARLNYFLNTSKKSNQ